jgi:hypothetical protein
VTKNEAHVTESKTQTVIFNGFFIEAMRRIVMHTDDLIVAKATT